MLLRNALRLFLCLLSFPRRAYKHSLGIHRSLAHLMQVTSKLKIFYF